MFEILGNPGVVTNERSSVGADVAGGAEDMGLPVTCKIYLQEDPK